MRSIITILTIIFFASNVQAFDLFNPDRGKPPPPKVNKQFTGATTGSNSKKLPTPFIAKAIKPNLNKKPKKFLPQRNFYLKGTSIIGDKRAAILVAPDKKEFIQYFKNNIRTPIKSEKFKGYFLLNVEAREVEIEYPIEAPCRKDIEKYGVKCVEKNDGVTTAKLNLTQRKALKAPKPPASPKPPINKAEIDKKRKKALEKRKKIYKNFKRKVIKDEDVPPGMRVVRTPFGDRLVPIK